jgi:hypothetical protein
MSMNTTRLLFVIAFICFALALLFLMFDKSAANNPLPSSREIGDSSGNRTSGVLAAQAQAPSFLTRGLLAYYPFNGNANDASGHGNDGTVNGAALTQDRFGTPNAAYDFNGASSFIALPRPLVNQLAGTNPVSVSVWFQTPPEGPNEIRDLIEFGAGQANQAFIVEAQRGGQYVYSEYGNDYNVYSQVVVADGAWHHGATVYNAGTVTLYVDGIQRAGAAVVSDRAAAEGYIGRNLTSASPHYYWRGKIDDARFYNRALSPDEVQQLYRNESAAPDHFLR